MQVDLRHRDAEPLARTLASTRAAGGGVRGGARL